MIESIEELQEFLSRESVAGRSVRMTIIDDVQYAPASMLAEIVADAFVWRELCESAADLREHYDGSAALQPTPIQMPVDPAPGMFHGSTTHAAKGVYAQQVQRTQDNRQRPVEGRNTSIFSKPGIFAGVKPQDEIPRLAEPLRDPELSWLRSKGKA